MSNSHILIVDDVADNIQIAMNLLREDGYQFSYANDGPRALAMLEESGDEFDLILLDVMMPGMDGFEVCRQIKNKTPWHEVPIIFLTARAEVEAITRGFDLGGVDYVTKPFHGAELLARVRTHVQLYNARKILQQKQILLENKLVFSQNRLLSELEDTQKELIWVLTELMEATSDETGKHIRRVSEISALFAHLHPTLDESDANALMHASPMHDIGKMTIPHDILHKPGRLTADEFEIMKRHTSNAYTLLSSSKRKLFKAAAIIAHEHHEKWDGSGYPRGLKASQIHIYGRIVALADVFDALTHRRCYKDAWEVDEALDYIRGQRGRQFDPELVDLLFDNLGQFLAILELS
ncbi:response regulator [Mangrovimicrobium sediminis]|uniref:Response regulator n=1 Tax=Mangrovimicrobium sediminis TaxID=2562682 RepID=A0A4Z0LXJ0_9GAMM|nr:HD domain-containing phosphohydrolase [Haliea sp. SAOS-164]TGD72052.1 response regulator [Haliea sp. SAOS-164]